MILEVITGILLFIIGVIIGMQFRYIRFKIIELRRAIALYSDYKEYRKEKNKKELQRKEFREKQEKLKID